MQITNFSDLLDAARAQGAPQRLLFLFAVRELPVNHTPGQKKRFDAGQGGALTPVMCVDKEPGELADFAALARESAATGQPWDVVFAAALTGQDGAAPRAPEVERALRMMVDAVHRGAIERFIAFGAQGQAMRFT
ncbi:ribonucleotide reductase subunit alpha [Massilia oculi]|uniref:ribonucleotide reductase subunit alpha n=1 Tax=Massilia oculi TaxID=945844 RepID=UPI001AAF31AE|nr:ribonucleotide reductase subunit alpha [Massilia oculi]